MRRAVLTAIAIAVLGVLSLCTVKSDSAGSSGTNTLGQAADTTPTQPSNSEASQSSQASGSKYKDGSYTGTTADTPYGPVQVSVSISRGQITDIQFLQMPSDEGHSREVTEFSEPLLKKNTISAQSADIDFVSGATSTVYGYQESLQAALDKAAGTVYTNPSGV